jgi:signal transduction histidine kinase
MTDTRMGENSIPFNFTYYAMKLLGKNLYSNPWTAISELVANGIDSKAKTVHVLVDMRDKEHAVVEIFDDGYGMSHSDLETKYTVIGRNKRESDENILGKTLGRKGIGKLAALYLSPEYYLFTKSNGEESAWCVNTLKYTDSDFPALDRIDYNTTQLISEELWNNQSQGTMIHLADVDLRKIGTERLKQLPLSMADYYLSNVIDCHIRICILQKNSDPLKFQEIKKDISFETMYAIFDNTHYGYSERLLPSVYLTKQDYRVELNYPRKTQCLDPSKYDCEGIITMTDLEGVTREIRYSMEGWIGIHCSLDNEVLLRNSTKGKKRRPNALRLYVRGKLAVDNLMNYIKSSQALANYIEGEISFDVLDDDFFEDASTSSREGYSISDPRIQKLIEITKPIVRALITERTAIGNVINSELRELREKELAEERARKAEAERQMREAEEQARKEEAARKKEEEARKAAEEERDKAKAESESDRKRLFVLENNFVSDGERYKHGVHLAVNFAKEIRGTTMDYYGGQEIDYQEVRQHMMEIDRYAEKIVRLPSFLDAVNFSMISPEVTMDLVEFIKQYIENRGNAKLKYSFNICAKYEREFDFPEIIMFVENTISNAIKAGATQLNISAYTECGKLRLDFVDDGKGLDAKYRYSPADIFKLGETTTIGGFGIGCFHMREIVDGLGGNIYAIQNRERGLTIRVIL